MRLLAAIFLAITLGCSIPTLDEVILRPAPTIEYTPTDYGYAYEEVTLPVAEGREIVAWYIPSVESKGLVVLLLGSDANKGRYCEGIPIFNPNGYDLLLADYEGFGSSPGTISLNNTVDDAMTVVSYAKTRHSNVFVFGVSLGTPLTTYVAANMDLKGIILEGSFIASQEAELWLRQNDMTVPFFWDIANGYIYPQTPEAFDILKYIQQVSEPKLIMHSIEDEVTPYESGLRVFNTAPEPKEFWQMRGPHGKMVRLETEAYTNKIIGWLDSHLN